MAKLLRVLKGGIKLVTNSGYRFSFFAGKGMYNKMSDESYLKKVFYYNFAYPLDLENPKTFNEKMQYLKLFNRREIFTKMVDKYEVKQLVSDIVGSSYVIPLIGKGIYSSIDEIDFTKLPNKFVIKTTHDCGGVIVCTNKNTLDIKKVRSKLNKSLHRNYYWHCREWPYKNAVPRILVEQYIKDSHFDYLPVFKFFCFDGEPSIIQVIQDDKQPTESIDYFDTDWNLLNIRQNYPNSKNHIAKPEKLDEMLEICRKLSILNKPFIRVDLYYVNGSIYFSEFTFFSDAGFEPFYPKEWDDKLGSLINLDEIKKNS